ncbi:MAG: hypothetical protein R2796_02260 [Chitinophagaceae bacterium]|nr:hypothetical protein [Chitinophagaceae bacterium]
MKKIILMLVFVSFISVSGWAENYSKPLPTKFKIININQNNNEVKIYEYRCFDLEVYTVCGYVWEGDVCVYTDLHWLTDAQIWTAIHFTDLRLCGYTDGEVVQL